MRGPLLFAIDIDGTLLNSGRTLDERNWTAIQQAMQSGHFVSLATGRMPAPALVWARYLQLNAPVVTLNGADVVESSTGKSLSCSRIGEEPLLRLVEWVEEQRLHCRLMGHRYTVCRKYQLDYVQRVWGVQFRNPEVLLAYNLRDYLAQPAEPVLKVAVGCQDSERQAQVYAELRSWNAFEIARTEQCELELTARGTTKLSGVIRVIEQLNIPLANVIAFGNGENDVDLLRHAGKGYAVANAEPVVLEQISLRTASNDECGVAQVMERIIAEADLRLA